MAKSPGGSTFPYYYKGGELHALKYGSHFADEARLLALMDAEEVFLQEWPALRFPMWVDFNETALSDAIVARFAAQARALRPQLLRLAVVGCSQRDCRRLEKALRAAAPDLPLAFRSDPEEAKTWLISDGNG